MLFDSWGGVLSTQTYGPFSLDPMKKIIAGLHLSPEGKKVPVIMFTKNGHPWLESMVDSGADALGIDWSIDLATARARVADKVALQVNLEPSVLYSSPDNIRREVHRVMNSYGEGPGHIFNFGHGMLPDIPFEHVEVLVDAVHSFDHAKVSE